MGKRQIKCKLDKTTPSDGKRVCVIDGKDRGRDGLDKTGHLHDNQYDQDWINGHRPGDIGTRTKTHAALRRVC